MNKLIAFLFCACLWVGCKQTVVLPPDNELSFQLETPDDGNVSVTSNSVGEINFTNHIRLEVIAEAPMMKLFMTVVFDDIVTESGKPTTFSLEVVMYEEDRDLFAPAGNGVLYFYTDPQDFVDRFLAPIAPEDIRRYMSIYVDYDHLSMYGSNNSEVSSIEITAAELVESPDEEQLVVVTGKFAQPIAAWYQYPDLSEFTTKEGHFRFTINLSEIY